MLKSFGDRLLVRIVEVPAGKKGILIMPEEKKDFQIGQVVDVNPGTVAFKCGSDGVQESYYVYTRKYAGLLVEYDGVEYISLDSKEVLAYSRELR